MVRKVSTTEWNDRQIAQRKEFLRGQVEKEYQSSLERGFQFDNGQFPATGPKRARVTEYVASINAGKGLPQGKSTLTFRDMDGTGHDLDADGITDLGAKGSDLVDQADDRYEELQGAIEAAETLDELNALDPTAGWPN